jgi:hypothetical protein
MNFILRGSDRVHNDEAWFLVNFLFKRDVLKVAWFLFLVNFFESSEGHKGKKCLSKSRETHVFWVPSSI